MGTLIAQGKKTKLFNGETYLLETGLVADLAIVKAWKADPYSNLVYRKSAQILNPIAATSGRTTVAEVEHLVGSGELDPDSIYALGVFIKRLIPAILNEKCIEQRAVRVAA